MTRTLRSQPTQRHAQQQGRQGNQRALPAHAVGIDQQFVFRHQHRQLQPLGAAFLNAAAGNDPVDGPSAVRRLPCAGLSSSAPEAGTQVGGLGQARGLIVDDQATAVGISDGIALGIEQHDLGAGVTTCLARVAESSARVRSAADHRMLAAAPGQGGADVVGREKDVGLGGDLVEVLAGAGKPGAATRVIGFVGIVLTADKRQVLIEKQGLRMRLATAVSLDAPYLVGRGIRGLEQRFQMRACAAGGP